MRHSARAHSSRLARATAILTECEGEVLKAGGTFVAWASLMSRRGAHLPAAVVVLCEHPGYPGSPICFSCIDKFVQARNVNRLKFTAATGVTRCVVVDVHWQLRATADVNSCIKINVKLSILPYIQNTQLQILIAMS